MPQTLLAAGHAINAYEHLMTRVDPKLIEKLVERQQGIAAPRHRKQQSQQRHAEHQQQEVKAEVRGRPATAPSTTS